MLMRKIMLGILLVSSMVFAGGMLDKNLLQKVEMLNNAGEYELARDILKDLAVDKESSVEVMDYWLEIDKQFANELSSHTVDSITALIVNPKTVADYALEIFTKENMMVELIPLLSVYDKFTKVNKTVEFKHKCTLELKNQHISLMDISKAKKILEKYNILKKSLIQLKKMQLNYIKKCNIDELKSLRSQMKKLKELKNKIKKDRTNFVSYAVVSPYLANADRLIRLSKAESIIGHSEEYLKEAAKTMARGAYKDLLLQSNQDVRDQFLNVYAYMKGTAGDKEWEDLKVVQTLSDSVSNSKKGGADLWWQ